MRPGRRLTDRLLVRGLGHADLLERAQATEAVEEEVQREEVEPEAKPLLENDEEERVEGIEDHAGDVHALPAASPQPTEDHEDPREERAEREAD